MKFRDLLAGAWLRKRPLGKWTQPVTLIGHPYAAIGRGEHLRAVSRALGKAGIAASVMDVDLREAPSEPEFSKLRPQAVTRLASGLRIFHLNGDALERRLGELEARQPGSSGKATTSSTRRGNCRVTPTTGADSSIGLTRSGRQPALSMKLSSAVSRVPSFFSTTLASRRSRSVSNGVTLAFPKIAISSSSPSISGPSLPEKIRGRRSLRSASSSPCAQGRRPTSSSS